MAGVAVGMAVALGGGGGSDAPGPGEAATEERLDVAIVGGSLIEQSRDQFAAHAGELGLSVEAVAFGGSAPCDWQEDFEQYAAERPRALIVSFAGNDNTPCINPALGGEGAFHRTLPCESWEQAVCGPDGTVAVRNDDGIHLTEAGGERYARALLSALGHPVAG